MALFESINKMNESRKQTGRRRFLFGAVGLMGSYFGFRWWRDKPRPVPQIETKYITPNDDFYTISIDTGFVPAVTKETWKLKIDGPGGRGYSLSYDELLKLDRRRVFKTFMCVGNEVGGPAMGNAEWTVTPLAPLISRVVEGEKNGLRVVFHALDGFYSSVPLDVAMDGQSFIAYEMNGETLPGSHGYPARVLLPNIYGMKQPRWLSRIEVTSRSESGYWEKRGWCGECNVRMTARIDSAVSQKDGSWMVTGIAYCGDKPPARVEISDDQGTTWREATFTSERLPNAWATWQFPWKAEKKGEIILTARVLDSAGNRQIESYTGNFPSGATGLHRVIVRV